MELLIGISKLELADSGDVRLCPDSDMYQNVITWSWKHHCIVDYITQIFDKKLKSSGKKRKLTTLLILVFGQSMF